MFVCVCVCVCECLFAPPGNGLWSLSWVWVWVWVWYQSSGQQVGVHLDISDEENAFGQVRIGPAVRVYCT